MIKASIVGMCQVLLTASPLLAGIINIVVGDPVFILNSGVQSFDVYVSSTEGSSTVQGLNFVMDIGGFDVNAFLSTDIVSNANMLFYYSNTGQVEAVDYPSCLIYATTTTSGSMTATIGANEILLGTVYVDTNATGLIARTYPLRMSETEYGDTDFAGVSANITNGTITFRNEAVPEPGALLLMGGLMACGGPALGWYRRRRGAATWAGRRAKDGQGLAREG